MDPSSGVSVAPVPSLPPSSPDKLAPTRRTQTQRLLRLWVLIVLLALILLGLARAGAEVYASYQIRAADKALERQNYKEAKPHLEAALKVRPNSADLHLRLGRLCRQMNNLDEAYEHLKACRRLEGESEAYQLEMLMCRAQSGFFEEVLGKLWVYYEQDRPEAPLVCESLTLSCMSQDMIGMALGMADHWLQKQPDNVQALYYKGWCNSELGSVDVALVSLEKAVARDPDREDIQQMRGFMLCDLQRYDEARTIIENYLKNHPDDALSLLYLARCLYGKGQTEQAQEVLSRAIDDNNIVTPALLAERGK